MDYPQHNVLELKQLGKLVLSDGLCLGFECNQLKVQMTGYFVKVLKNVLGDSRRKKLYIGLTRNFAEFT